MTEEGKLYKIRRIKDGLYSDGGTYPSFSKKGKTWTSRGAMIGHLVQAIPTSSHNSRHVKEGEAITYGDGSGCEIIEIIVRYEDGTHQSLSEEISRIGKRRILTKKYGKDLATLLDNLDKRNQINDFQWGLVFGHSTWGNEWKQFTDCMKDLGIKRTHIRTSGNVVAFANKEQAMRVRLTITGSVKSLDLVKLSEDF